MDVLIFGATGMVGQGVLRECLLDPEVGRVVSVVRSATGRSDPKLREIVHADFMDYSALTAEFAGLDACFYCLGVSSVGASEAEYRRVTYGFTMALAEALVRVNPRMTFVYVSARGADSTEKGRVMWARVRGEVENALGRLPFEGVYSVRPGIIQPLHGVRSRTPLYNKFYDWGGWIFPLVEKFAPEQVTSTEKMGRVMLRLARYGYPKRVLEMPDLHRVASMR